MRQYFKQKSRFKDSKGIKYFGRNNGEKRQDGFYDVLKWRIENKRSNIIIVVGEQGSGILFKGKPLKTAKSNTSLFLCYWLNRLFYKKKMNFDDHLYHSILRFTRKLPTIRNSFVMLEEVGEGLSKVGFTHLNR